MARRGRRTADQQIRPIHDIEEVRVKHYHFGLAKLECLLDTHINIVYALISIVVPKHRSAEVWIDWTIVVDTVAIQIAPNGFIERQTRSKPDR